MARWYSCSAPSQSQSKFWSTCPSAVCPSARPGSSATARDASANAGPRASSGGTNPYRPAAAQASDSPACASAYSESWRMARWK